VGEDFVNVDCAAAAQESANLFGGGFAITGTFRCEPEPVGDEAVGEAPERHDFEIDGGEEQVARKSGDVAEHVAERVAQDGHRNPARFDGFARVETRGELEGHMEDERRDREVGAGAAARGGQRKRGFEGVAREEDAALFGELAQRGAERIGIAAVAAPARETQLARPGIVGALRAPDQQHGIFGLVRPQDGNCRFHFSHLR